MQSVPTKTPTTETPTSESLIKERDRGHVLVPWRAQGGERGPVVRDSLARHCDEHRFVHGHTYSGHALGCAAAAASIQVLVGPVPGARGLWTATGCNVSGFSASPAVGQVLAEWITAGEPSIDLGPLQLDRFAGISLGPAQVTARGVWQCAHFYDPEASRAA
jgi:hypothetical protein